MKTPCNAGAVIVLHCLGVLLFATGLNAGAQAYPSRTIRMVAPFAPGGSTDANARIVSQKLSEQLGISVVVDNRPGAASMLGTELVVRAAPNGYTLLTAAPELTINPSLQPKVPYDALRDLAAISQTASSQFMLSTHPSVPINSVKELIALAKARPGQLTYGSSGSGSANHLAGVLFQGMTGTSLVHIPFKGGGPATIALMGGEIDFMFTSTSAVVAQIKAGKLRAIAVTGAQRLSEMPNIPTVSESGVPGFEVTGWYGVLAPAGTPREIINKLGAEIAKVVQDSTVRERFASLGTVPVGSSPEQFTAFLRAETEKWSRVVKASGARPD